MNHFLEKLIVILFMCLFFANSAHTQSFPIEKPKLIDSINLPTFGNGYIDLSNIVFAEILHVKKWRKIKGFKRLFFSITIDELGKVKAEKDFYLSTKLQKEFPMMKVRLLEKINSWEPAFYKATGKKVSSSIIFNIESYGDNWELILYDSDFIRFFCVKSK